MTMGSTMTVGKRFIITSGVLVLLSTALSIVSIVGFNNVRSDVHSMAVDTVPGITYAALMRADANEVRGNVLRRVVETTPEATQKADRAIVSAADKFAADMKSYEAAIGPDEGDHQRFETMKSNYAVFSQKLALVQVLFDAGKNADAWVLIQSSTTPPMTAVRTELDDMVARNRQDSDKTINEATQTSQAGWWMSLTMGLISIVLGVVVSWFMIRALNRQLTAIDSELSEGADQIASAAAQVSTSSQSLAQGSSEQAASLEETSSSAEEINSMACKNTDNASVMTELVSGAQQEFEVTNRQLGEMVVAMDEINGSSSKISKIIKVIDEIAFQTNILALNAAVEAARAGEAGMGFAVVAEEVRNLAQRCAQAAQDTTGLIEESVAKSGEGKTKLGLVDTSIKRITEEFTRIKTLVDEVSHGSKEQSDGIGNIGKALSQMEQVTQSTAANAEESAAAAEELNAQSEALKDIVLRLNSMVGGNAASTIHYEGTRARDEFAQFA